MTAEHMAHCLFVTKGAIKSSLIVTIAVTKCQMRTMDLHIKQTRVFPILDASEAVKNVLVLPPVLQYASGNCTCT